MGTFDVEARNGNSFRMGDALIQRWTWILIILMIGRSFSLRGVDDPFVAQVEEAPVGGDEAQPLGFRLREEGPIERVVAGQRCELRQCLGMLAGERHLPQADAAEMGTQIVADRQFSLHLLDEHL